MLFFFFFYTKYDIFNDDIFFSRNKYIDDDDIKFGKFSL